MLAASGAKGKAVVRPLGLAGLSIVGFLAIAAPANAANFALNGVGDNQTDVYGYYYAITGGLFPTGNAPNGDNASGGTFRYMTDDPAWGLPSAYQQWAKDDWFPQNAGLALTLKSGSTTVYDNNGIETGTYGNYYNAQAQGLPNASTPGLYRGYSMVNNFDFIYATYFKIEQDTRIDTIIGYFDPNGGASDPYAFNPLSPYIAYLASIWTAVDDPNSANPDSYLPATNTFLGDFFTTWGTAATVTVSDTGVDRVFSDGSSEDIYRVVFALEDPISLPAGVYFFNHSVALVPEPGSLVLFAGGIGLLALARRRRRSA